MSSSVVGWINRHLDVLCVRREALLASGRTYEYQLLSNQAVGLSLALKEVLR